MFSLKLHKISFFLLYDKEKNIKMHIWQKNVHKKYK